MSFLSRLPASVNIVLVHGEPYSAIIRFPQGRDFSGAIVTADIRRSFYSDQVLSPFNVNLDPINSAIELSLTKEQVDQIPNNSLYWEIPANYQTTHFRQLEGSNRLGFWFLRFNERTYLHGAVFSTKLS